MGLLKILKAPTLCCFQRPPIIVKLFNNQLGTDQLHSALNKTQDPRDPHCKGLTLTLLGKEDIQGPPGAEPGCLRQPTCKGYSGNRGTLSAGTQASRYFENDLNPADRKPSPSAHPVHTASTRGLLKRPGSPGLRPQTLNSINLQSSPSEREVPHAGEVGEMLTAPLVTSLGLREADDNFSPEPGHQHTLGSRWILNPKTRPAHALPHTHSS